MTDSGSSRHRSSTLKPIRQPPARLNLSPRSENSTQFKSTSPARTKFTPFSAGPTARPSSPTPRPTSPTPTNTNQHTGGIRAHFAHLLPKHAVFTATLTLHQLHNVPLVHGEFGLKWQIKGVTSHSGSSLLDKVKARKTQSKLYERSRPGTTAELPTSITKGSDTDNASLFDAASVSDTHSIANSSSTHSHSNDHLNSINGSAHGHATYTQPLPIPAVVVSVNHSSPSSMTRSVSGTSTIASVSSASSMSAASPYLNGRFHNPPGYLSADWSRHGPAHSSTSTHDTGTPFVPPSDTTHYPQTPAKFHYSPAKGITPFVRLKEHNVVWEKTLKFMVQMSVGRDNSELGECLAKFVVTQRVIAGDPDAPRNPRLGVVYLNLAQYVDAGVITRRYLLRQSKTNATLKLSVHVEHTAGELAYVAPPLPKGEILSGVAGILESSDIYRTRPRASDLYTHASSDSSSDDVVAASGSDTSSIVSGSGVSNGVSSHGHSVADGQGRHATVKKQRRPFEVTKLPTINDPRGTEKLIEALFNPVPVTQLSKVTPFTYLVEVDGEGDGDGDGDGEQSLYGADRAATTHEAQGTRPGMAALADGEGDDSSLYADSQDESSDGADGLGSDYHSLRSHPSFQGSLRSKHSIRSLSSKVELKHDDAVEDTAVSTGVHLLGGVTERRTWWQKVLSPPAAG